MRHRQRGFTLTELLVVIGIIAVLTAILVPVFFTARNNGQRTACASNLRQLAAASLLYAQDNDGILPHSSESGMTRDDWFAQIKPLVTSKDVFRCPSCALPDKLPLSVEGEPVFGYAANGNINLAWVNSEPLVREGDVRHPAATVFLTEIHFIQHPNQETATRYCVHAPDVLDENSKGPGYFLDDGATVVGLQGGKRHAGGCNYAFVDGHVKWLKPEAVDWRENDENGQALPPPNGSRPSFRWK